MGSGGGEVSVGGGLFTTMKDFTSGISGGI